jgi:hypothetical protein
MKKYIPHIIVALLCIALFAVSLYYIIPITVNSVQNTETTVINTTVYEEITPHIFYVAQENSEATLVMLEECYMEIEYLVQSAEHAPDAIASEIDRINDIILSYQSDYDRMKSEEEKWQKRYDKYPVATKVWLYMKNNFGWNDVVCAGVMGNIMAEIGGGTLNFDNWDYDKNTYGMFQWLGGRKKDLKKIYGSKPSIEEQLEFMYDEL